MVLKSVIIPIALESPGRAPSAIRCTNKGAVHKVRHARENLYIISGHAQGGGVGGGGLSQRDDAYIKYTIQYGIMRDEGGGGGGGDGVHNKSSTYVMDSPS